MDLLIQHQTALSKWVGESGRWTKTSVLLRLLGTPHLRQRLRRNDVAPPARVDLSWFTWRAFPDGGSTRPCDIATGIAID